MTEKQFKPVAIPLTHAIVLTIFWVAFSSIFALPVLNGTGDFLDYVLVLLLVVFLPGAAWFSRWRFSKKTKKDEDEK